MSGSRQANKKAPSQRRCLVIVSASEHALLTAVPYVEEGARVRGLDGTYSQHEALPDLS